MECRKPQKRKNLRLLILTTNPSKPGHDVAGLFFCLASAEDAGLLFCPAAMQPYTSVYSAFCTVNASYTAHATKQRTELCSGFSRGLPHFTAYNTRQTKADITPPATRWSVSQRNSASSIYLRYHRRAGRCAAQHSRPIIIRYISGHRCPLLWIHARRCSIQQTMQARRVQLLPCVDRWQVLHPAHLVPGTIHPAGQSSSRGAAGGAEPLAALAASLFGLSPDS